MNKIILYFFFISFFFYFFQFLSGSVTDYEYALSEEEKVQLNKNTEHFSFQASVERLLNILIHSVYSNKDVAIRELISNAADALEKARLLSLSNPEYLSNNPDLEIRISIHPDSKTLVIQDTGIGMTKNDLVSNLGTIAKSGTSEFLKSLATSNEIDANLIGQFGVGFYSSFLLAKKVTVVSKNNNDPVQHIWESEVNNAFTVSEDPRGDTLGRGTQLILHLRDDAEKYMEESYLKSVILEYSQFVHFPIKMRTVKVVTPAKDEKKKDDDSEKENDTESTDDNETDTSKDDSETDKTQVDENPSDDDEKKVDEVVHEWNIINAQKPIWLRPKSEITEEDYNNLFTLLYKGSKSPLLYNHFNAEGDFQFQSIIYIPSVQPRNVWEHYHASEDSNIRLYSHGVLVSEKIPKVLPKYLSFVHGIVDSNDLPIKIDRESVTDPKIIKTISTKLVSKILESINKLYKAYNDSKEGKSENSEKIQADYRTFSKLYNNNLSIGCIDDKHNRNKIVKLMVFHSNMLDKSETITLDVYIKNMKENQNKIFYTINDDFDTALQSPYMEFYVKKGFEVLILNDIILDNCFSQLKSYNGVEFVAIEKYDFLDASKAKTKKKLEKKFKPLVSALEKALEGQVGGVRISLNLSSEPVIIISDNYGLSGYSDRVMRSQSFSNQMNLSLVWFRKLHINPYHPLINHLLQLVKDNPNNPEINETAFILHETALLNSGYVLSNPTNLAKKLYSLLSAKVGVDNNMTIEEVDEEEEEEEEKNDSDGDHDDSTDIDSELDSDKNSSENHEFDSDVDSDKDSQQDPIVTKSNFEQPDEL